MPTALTHLLFSNHEDSVQQPWGWQSAWRCCWQRYCSRLGQRGWWWQLWRWEAGLTVESGRVWSVGDEGLDKFHKGKGVPSIGHGWQQELGHLLCEAGAEQCLTHCQQHLTAETDSNKDSRTLKYWWCLTVRTHDTIVTHTCEWARHKNMYVHTWKHTHTHAHMHAQTHTHPHTSKYSCVFSYWIKTT